MTKCDVCGFNSAVEVKVEGRLKIPFGPEAVYEQSLINCSTCGGSIDITEDRVRIQAIKKAERESIGPMIDHIIHEEDYTIKDVERIFGLPFGILDKWRDLSEEGSEITPEGLALLRILSVFPPLIQLAENNYATNT